MLKNFFKYIRNKTPQKLRVIIAFYRNHGYFPNIRNPSTFSECIARRKIYDRKDELPKLADKILVKDFVKENLGASWVITTIWSGERLPSRDKRDWHPPYVLKANNGSATNIFIRTNEDIDWRRIEKITAGWDHRDYGHANGEWLYSKIVPGILVEEYVGRRDTLPTDYKFWVFYGKVQFVQIDTNRSSNHRRCFYSREWNKLPFGLCYPIEEANIPQPNALSQMIDGAEKLASSFDFARVDLYEISGEPKFGEITFYPGSGHEVFTDKNIDIQLGELWNRKISHLSF